jgi:hypothetical protein
MDDNSGLSDPLLSPNLRTTHQAKGATYANPDSIDFAGVAVAVGSFGSINE